MNKIPPRGQSPAAVGEQSAGLLAAVVAFVLWGFLPLYFHAIGTRVSVWEIVAHRTVWAAVVLGLFHLLPGRAARLRAVLSNPRLLLALAASSACIALNWLTFIWAVSNGHVLDSSLGYYITPLLNVLMGMVFLRERFRPLQYLAVAVAAAGVVATVVAYGQAPWVALTLAVAFATYGLIRKQVPVESATGLQVETLLLAPFALLLLAWLHWHHRMAFLAVDLRLNLLLVGAGAVTVVPLVLFAAGTRRLRLGTIGLLQYITPTAQFVTGLFLFHEPWTGADSLTFVCIWLALGIYSADTLRARRAYRRRGPQALQAGKPHVSEKNP